MPVRVEDLSFTPPQLVAEFEAQHGALAVPFSDSTTLTLFPEHGTYGTIYLRPSGRGMPFSRVAVPEKGQTVHLVCEEPPARLSVTNI